MVSPIPTGPRPKSSANLTGATASAAKKLTAVFLQEFGLHDTPQCASPGSLIRAELEQIANQYEAADRRAKRAATIPVREAAEDERREAEGDFWAAGEQLADLFLLMIRHCKQYRPDILQLYLAELLRPELEPLAQAIIRMEARR
jgi:hypothetical protein